MQNFQYLLEGIFENKINSFSKDFEAKDYYGSDFKIKQFYIKYRKAKITPKKVGCFVALWKRGSDGKTTPFDVSDEFDFYFIEVEDSEKNGIFIFSKTILETHGILSSNKKGKCGFRLYPSWCVSLNTTAQKTQNWQLPYFIDLNKSEENNINQFKKIFQI